MHLQSQGILQRWLRSRTSLGGEVWWGDHLIMRQFGRIPAWAWKEKKLSSCYLKAEEGQYKKRFCCCYYYCLLLCRLWQQIKEATSQVEGHSWRGSTRRARATLNVTGPSYGLVTQLGQTGAYLNATSQTASLIPSSPLMDWNQRLKGTLPFLLALGILS